MYSAAVITRNMSSAGTLATITSRVVMPQCHGHRARMSAYRAGEAPGLVVDGNVHGSGHALVDGDAPVDRVLRIRLLPVRQMLDQHAGLRRDLVNGRIDRRK